MSQSQSQGVPPEVTELLHDLNRKVDDMAVVLEEIGTMLRQIQQASGAAQSGGGLGH